jgi:hypothetical protein
MQPQAKGAQLAAAPAGENDVVKCLGCHAADVDPAYDMFCEVCKAAAGVGVGCRAGGGGGVGVASDDGDDGDGDSGGVGGGVGGLLFFSDVIAANRRAALEGGRA